MATPAAAPRYVATWRIVLAFLLDLVTVFGVAGYLIAVLAGQTTDNGFNLTGGPALLLLAVLIGYFVGARFWGGTLWQRILRARRVRGETY